MTQGPVVVIGSINMDLVCRADHHPVPGETILGGEFAEIPGGKGANQAVGVARLGAKVEMIGRVGDDEFGKTLLRGLKENGVGVKHVKVTQGVASGVAMIVVNKAGENSIVVAPGANGKVTKKDIDVAKSVIAKASVVVLQLEIPMDVVEYTIALCRKLGVKTILDPAPAPAKAAEGLLKADLVSPNETEAAALVGKGDAGKTLLARGVKEVVLKQGSKGAVWMDGTHSVKQSPFKVKVVDTTAAGDAFTAGLAVGLSEGWERAEILKFACAAGALSCTKMGAQTGLPWRKEVERLSK